MIAINNCSGRCLTGWQQGFAEILPEIEARLGQEFRYVDSERRDECVQNGSVLCLLAYMRLFQQGRVDQATPASLAWYAALQVKSGREAGCRLNVREPLSRYAQLRQGIHAQPLQSYSTEQGTWIDLMVDARRSSVADQVAARLDIRAWLAQLARRTRQIARDMAHGFTTSELACKYRLSASRVSQLRRELEASWADFQHEPVTGTQ